jgi:hypothetical protein
MDFFFFFNGSTALLLGSGLLFSFIILFTDHRTPWTSDQPVARPLPTHRTIQTQNKRIHKETSMPRVGFEPRILASERAKTVHALDRSATVIGTHNGLHGATVCAKIYSRIGSMMEQISETWLSNSILSRLRAREDLCTFFHRKSFKSYIKQQVIPLSSVTCLLQIECLFRD